MTIERVTKTVLARLRHDRAAVDPILAIASIAVTTIVSAAIVGALVMVINLGSNYVKEQTISTAAGQAQKAFAKDAQNSGSVGFIGQKSVLFTETSAKTSAMSSTRGRPYTCRESLWRVKGWWLENYVGFTNDSGATPCASITEEDRVLLTSIRVTKGTAKFESVNAAGKSLRFNTDGVQVASPDLNTGEYWSDAEWASGVPRTISFTASTDMPISGKRAVELSGRTYLGPGDLGLPPAWTPAGDSQDINVAAVTNVTFARGITGATWGGEKESLRISWTGSTCGTYPVLYTVDWASKSNPAQSFNVSVGPNLDPTGAVELSPVPHGTIADLQITASCPTEIEEDSTDGVYSKLGHETPIPAPVISVTPTTANVHTVSWEPVSSLATSYTTQGRVALASPGAWGKTTETSIAKASTSTTVLSQKITWPVGSTYGLPYEYHVKAEVGGGGAGSPWSAPAGTGTVAVAVAPTPTKITPKPAALTSYDRTNTSCPTGTVVEFRSQQSLSGAPMGAFGSWSKSTVVATGAGQGVVVAVRVETRCTANGQVSATTGPVSKTWTTMLNPPTPLTVTIPAQQQKFSWTAVTCGAGATAYYRWSGFTLDGKAAAGPTTAWAKGATVASRTRTFTAGQGRTAVVTVKALCRTATGDSAQVTGSDKEIYKITAVLAPKVAANFPTNFQFWASGTCPAGLTPQAAATWTLGNGKTGTAAWGSASKRNGGAKITNGNTIEYKGWGRCYSNYSKKVGPAQTTTLRYYGSTPSRPNTYVSRYSNAVGQRFNVTVASTACRSNGMRTKWYVGYGTVSRGTTWGSSYTISDYWNSPGYRVYSGYVRCVDSDGNAGKWSAVDYASVSVYSPAPTTPTWVSVSSGTFSSTRGGGYMFNFSKLSAGGSSYSSGYTKQNKVETLWGATGWGSNSCVDNSTRFILRASAYGPGGSSAWRTSSAKSIATLSVSKQVC